MTLYMAKCYLCVEEFTAVKQSEKHILLYALGVGRLKKQLSYYDKKMQFFNGEDIQNRTKKTK